MCCPAPHKRPLLTRPTTGRRMAVVGDDLVAYLPLTLLGEASVQIIERTANGFRRRNATYNADPVYRIDHTLLRVNESSSLHVAYGGTTNIGVVSVFDYNVRSRLPRRAARLPRLIAPRGVAASMAHTARHRRRCSPAPQRRHHRHNHDRGRRCRRRAAPRSHQVRVCRGACLAGASDRCMCARASTAPRWSRST